MPEHFRCKIGLHKWMEKNRHIHTVISEITNMPIVVVHRDMVCCYCNAEDERGWVDEPCGWG